MVTFQVLFYILLLSSQPLLCIACDVKHTKELLYGYHCVSISNTEVTMPQADCVLQCLRKKTCHFINHNYGIGKCNLGLGKCQSLKPVSGGAVKVFGQPRDACLYWGNLHGDGRVLVEVQTTATVINVLARMVTDDNLLIGKFNVDRNKFWANNEGIRVATL